jgi:hypothetical protein
LKSLPAVLSALAVPALIWAVPAAADEDAFVDRFTTKHAFLTEEQLRAEGPRICAVLGSGVPASEAVAMVQDDLGVSVPAAFEIISAAITTYDC